MPSRKKRKRDRRRTAGGDREAPPSAGGSEGEGPPGYLCSMIGRRLRWNPSRWSAGPLPKSGQLRMGRRSSNN